MSEQPVDIFIAATPFQLLNITEAASYFRDNHAQVLILMEDYPANSAASIEALLSYYSWSRIKRIRTKVKTGFLKQIWYLHLYRRKHIRHLFIADCRGWYFQLPMALNLKPQGKIFLVDDGAATVVAQQEYLPQQRIYDYVDKRKQDQIKKKIFRLMNLKTELQNTIHLFSFFDLKPFEGQLYIRNEMTLLMGKMNKEASTESQSVFIGSALVTIGLVDKETYINCVKLARGKVAQEIIYYPHRNESDEILAEIAAIPGITIRKNKYFLELELICSKVTPINIFSFWSTSLYTLHILFPEATLYFFKLSKDKFTKDYYDEAALIYSYYEKQLPLTSIEMDC